VVVAILDLGTPQEWPDEPRAVVEEIAEEVRRRIAARWGEDEDGEDWDEFDEDDDRRPYSCDLPSQHRDLSDDAEARLRAAFEGHNIVAYHANRLLPHEDEAILSGGLHVLSHDLIEEKLRRAAEAYPDVLSDDDLALLRRSGPLTWGGGKRLGLLWVVAPFSIFDGDASGFRNLNGDWGGEAIGRTDNGPAGALIAWLNELSSPAIVEVNVPVGDFPRWKDLWPVAVGALLDLREPWNEWALEVSVPGDRVTAIIHPDDPRWPGRLRTS
jgi:hypothetical protein